MSCDCCPFIKPEGLRWDKPNLTLGFDVPQFVPASRQIIWELAQEAVQDFLDEANGISVKLIDLGEHRNQHLQADILLNARGVDGEFGTLGMAVQPSIGESMEVPGLKIVITMDTDERWTRFKWFSVFKHEWLHAMGIGHAPAENNLMFATYTGRSDFGPWDVMEIHRRYPARGTLMQTFNNMKAWGYHVG